MKFYRCNHCGNIVVKLIDSGINTVCCGEDMALLTANTVDAAKEKHVPFVKVDGAKVVAQIGEVEHPMLDAHYIQFIALETDMGYQIKNLKPEEKPIREFTLNDGEKAVAVYEYCNLHGLWKVEL